MDKNTSRKRGVTMELKSGEKIDRYGMVGNHLEKVGQITIKFMEIDYKNIEHGNAFHKIQFFECQ